MLGSELTERTCLVCKVGIIVKTINPDTEIILDNKGEIQRVQATRVTKYHCNKCGAVYKFLPPPAENLAKGAN